MSRNFGAREINKSKSGKPPMGLTARETVRDTGKVSDFEEAREIEALIDRLSTEFPGVPPASVHQVASAAWAEVAHNPVRDAAPALAENAAKDSLGRYPTAPLSPESAADDAN